MPRKSSPPNPVGSKVNSVEVEKLCSGGCFLSWCDKSEFWGGSGDVGGEKYLFLNKVKIYI